jgi:DNA-binding NarL/FixJ family response regulator
METAATQALNMNEKITPISVAIIEDEEETSQVISELLADAGLNCLGIYPTAEAALISIPVIFPEVALVDINLPGMSGIECTERLKRLAPKTEVLMLTTYMDSDLIFDSLRAGAKGYVLKNAPPSELIQAIEQVRAGGAPMSMQIARKVVEHFSRVGRPRTGVETLTDREEAVLALLAQGFHYREISENIGVSLAAVKKRLHRVYEKLQVQTRTEATVKFLQGG